MIDGAGAYFIRVEFGMPQGTVLALTLLLCFVTDLPVEVTSQIQLFEDNCLLRKNLKLYGIGVSVL